MSKFYTDKAPTPVFAVTFVSNREGIIPPKKVNETPSNNKTTVNPEDIINDKYRYATGQKEKETELINLINDSLCAEWSISTSPVSLLSIK